MATKYRAYICCGPNCGPKGSRDLIDRLVDEVRLLGLAGSVAVLPTGCHSHCDSGPTMVVYPGPVYYEAVDIARLRQIAVAHFRDDRPIEDYFWQGKNVRVTSPNTTAEKTASQGITFMPKATQQPRGKPAERKHPVREVDDFKW